MDDYWRRKALLDDAQQSVLCRVKDEEVGIVNGEGKRRWLPGRQGKGKEKEEEGPKKPPAPSIIAALFKCSWSLFLPAALMKLVYDLMQFINPMILKSPSFFYSRSTHLLTRS